MTDQQRSYLSGQAEYAEAVTIPSGHYTATLEGVEAVTHELYGPRWRWFYVIAGANPDGGDFRLSVWSPPRISSSGIANIMAAALGQPYRKGQAFSFDAARGRQVQIYVELDEAEGRNRVKTATAAPQAPTNGAAATPAADPEYQAFLAAKRAKAAAADATDDGMSSLDELPF